MGSSLSAPSELSSLLGNCQLQFEHQRALPFKKNKLLNFMYINDYVHVYKICINLKYKPNTFLCMDTPV